MDLPLELPNLNVLKLQLTLNVIHMFLFGASQAHFHVLLRSLCGIVIPSASKHAYETKLLSEFMDILAEDVDLLEKHDILLHDSGVLLLVYILIFLKHLPQVIHIVLKVLALVSIFTVKVCVTLLILNLLLDVFLVETDDALLELLEVGNVMQAFEDVVLELLLEAFLLIKLLPQVSDLISETLLAHSQIINNKCEVLIHTVEVLELLTHLVGLLIQLLDLDLAGSNVTLELLDLVVKNELELLQLLRFLLQVVNSLVLITDCSFTLLNFTLL